MKVAVLGAGVVGVTSAWYLAEAGHQVTVVERRDAAGLETSFANGGQISADHAEPWAKPAALLNILRWIGREDAPLLFRPRADLAQVKWGLRFLLECMPGRFERNSRQLAGLAVYSRDCLRALREATGLSYHQSTRGILHFCSTQAELDDLARHVEAMRRLGIVREMKTAEECLAIEPALRATAVPVAGGAYSAEDETGDAHLFTEELAKRAAARGVSFLYGESIERIEAAGDSVTGVRLGRAGFVSADAYVMALGSYSPLLLRPLGISIPVYPLKGYSITVPLGSAVDKAPSASVTDEAHKIVVTRLGDRLRAAGTAELAGYDTGINRVRCEAIVQRVRELFPGIPIGNDVAYWAGLRPATPNNVPVIGRSRLRNLYLNTGHGTLGWTLACGSGRAVADLVSGRIPEVAFEFV